MLRMPCKPIWAGFIIAVAFWAAALPAAAGWVQVESDGTRSLISEGKMKHVSPEDSQWMAFDFHKGTITFVNPEKETFAQGSIGDYCAMMNQFMQAMDELAMGSDPEAGEEMADVKVVAAGEGGKIAGVATRKYKVMVEGELYEEIWLAEDTSLLAELTRTRHFRTLLECTSDTDDVVEASPAYRELMLKGWELKSVAHEFGEPEVNFEVVRLTETEIADEEFKVPSNYRQLPLEQMFGGE